MSRLIGSFPFNNGNVAWQDGGITRQSENSLSVIFHSRGVGSTPSAYTYTCFLPGIWRYVRSVFFCSDSDLRLRLVGVVVQRPARQCGIHLMSYMYTNILIEKGIAEYPKLSCCHCAIGPSVNIVQYLYLQVIRQVSCLEYALYIYLLVIMSDLYTYAC